MSVFRHVPPAWFYPRILVGAGSMLTPDFVARHKITHVINCAYPLHSPFWFREVYPHRYVCLYANDTTHDNILEWYPLFEETMHRFLSGDGTVFVHCQAGINRSASLALTYVCKNFGQEFDSTVRAVLLQRPIMFTNRVFMNQVKSFINGCVPRAEDTGYSHRCNNGDTGFSTSGNYTESKGIDETPIVFTKGTRYTEHTSI